MCIDKMRVRFWIKSVTQRTLQQNNGDKRVKASLPLFKCWLLFDRTGVRGGSLASRVVHFQSLGACRAVLIGSDAYFTPLPPWPSDLVEVFDRYVDCSADHSLSVRVNRERFSNILNIDLHPRSVSVVHAAATANDGHHNRVWPCVRLTCLMWIYLLRIDVYLSLCQDKSLCCSFYSSWYK